jgi:hypothetical protein
MLKSNKLREAGYARTALSPNSSAAAPITPTIHQKVGNAVASITFANPSPQSVGLLEHGRKCRPLNCNKGMFQFS